MQNEFFWRWLKTAAVLLAVMNANRWNTLHGSFVRPLRWSASFVLWTPAAGSGHWSGSWCRILIVFQVMAGISSLFTKGTLTGGLTVNSNIWKKKSEMLNPIIQLTILTFALGAAITPQLVTPFIGAHQLPDVINPTATPNGSNVSCFFENADFDSVTSDSTTANSSVRYEGPEPVQIAYSLAACINLLTAIVSFVIWALDRGQRRTKSYEHGENCILRGRSYSLNEDGRTIIDEEFTEEPPRDRMGSLDRLTLQKKFEDDRARHGEHVKPDMRKLFVKRQKLRHTKEFCTGNDENAAEAANVNSHDHPVIGNSIPLVTCSRNITPLFVIVILFFIVNGGLESMFNGLLYTLLNVYLNWTPRNGTLLVTFYYVTRLLIHVAVVLLARFISPVVLIVMDISFLVISSILMLVTINASPVLMWIAVILTGFATSNLRPSSITNAQRCFQVDGKVMGMFFGAIFLGVSTVSPTVGSLLESYGAIIFPAILLFLTVLEIVLFALWLVVARAVRRRHDETPVDDIVIQDERTPLIGR